jgi:hypothetical protein
MTATRRQQAGQLGGLVTRSRYDGPDDHGRGPGRAGGPLRAAGGHARRRARRDAQPRERARRIEAARLAHMAKMRLARKPKAVGR